MFGAGCDNRGRFIDLEEVMDEDFILLWSLEGLVWMISISLSTIEAGRRLDAEAMLTVGESFVEVDDDEKKTLKWGTPSTIE